MAAVFARALGIRPNVEPVPELTWNEALSGIFGTVSLAFWVFVLLPQLYENYRSKSAAGLSVAFLIIWFVGDVTNFAGATLAGLVPTVLATAVWYMLIDAALIGQVFYYNYINRRKSKQDEFDSSAHGVQPDQDDLAAVDEQAPLLRQSSVDVPGSRRLSNRPHRPSENGGLPALQELREGGAAKTGLKNAAAVLALFIAGTAAWGIAYGLGAWKPTPTNSGSDEQDDEPILALILGYTSAICYLGARIPQIVKNYREQSCEGLSLLFFILSTTGNITYGAQIFFHSLDRRYLITNLPWLIGSLGTIAEDFTIFVQFKLYQKDTTIEAIE